MAWFQIPGSNILKMAFHIIAKEHIQYYQFVDRKLNNVGQYLTEFAPAVCIKGSFQPVPRSLYETLGLDFQKEYFNFYTSKDLFGTERDVTGDQIWFQGQRFQCESTTAWHGIDGWVAVLCVVIENIDIAQPIFGFDVIPPVSNYQNFVNGNFVDEAF